MEKYWPQFLMITWSTVHLTIVDPSIVNNLGRKFNLRCSICRFRYGRLNHWSVFIEWQRVIQRRGQTHKLWLRTAYVAKILWCGCKLANSVKSVKKRFFIALDGKSDLSGNGNINDEGKSLMWFYIGRPVSVVRMTPIVIFQLLGVIMVSSEWSGANACIMWAI